MYHMINRAVLRFPDSDVGGGGSAKTDSGKDAMLDAEGTVLSGDDFGIGPLDTSITTEPPKSTNAELEDGNLKVAADVKTAAATAPAAEDKTTPAEVKTESIEDTVDAFESTTTKADATKAAVGDKILKPLPGSEGRDMTGFDASDIPALRAMPNDTFNYFKTRLPALVKRASEAESQLQQLVRDNGTPVSYFENPAGYMLNPSYQQKNQQFERASTEENHFYNQREAIRKGAAVYKKAVQYDDKGNLVTTDVVINDQNRQAIDDELTTALGRVGVLKSGIMTEANQIAQQHVQRNQQEVGLISAATKKYFPFYEEGQPTYTPEVKKAVADFLSIIPQSMQHSPLGMPLAKAFVLIKALNADNKRLRSLAPNQQQQQRQEEQVLSGPTGKAVQQQGGGKAGSEVLDNSGWDENNLR